MNYDKLRFSIYGVLVVESDTLQDAVDYIQRENQKEIRIGRKYTLDTVDFLRECPNITGVSFDIESPCDYSALFEMPNLKDLSVSGTLDRKHYIPVNELEHLESLAISECGKENNIGKCKKLKKLHIYQYKPKPKNLEELRDLKTLEELCLNQGNLVELSGIETLNLKRLYLYYIRNLGDISAVRGLGNTLTELEVEHCTKLTGYEALGALKKVHWLKLVKCGDIPSLKFVSQMDGLKKISFGQTNVIDGDISPCERLDYAGFTNKKHFSHTFKQLNPDWDPCRKSEDSSEK